MNALLSRKYIVPAKQLISMRSSDSPGVQDILSHFDRTMERKFYATHVFRIKQLAFLVGDLENYGAMDPSHFMRGIYQTHVATAFAYYEIDTLLSATARAKPVEGPRGFRGHRSAAVQALQNDRVLRTECSTWT
jgi:hypothetical protein